MTSLRLVDCLTQSCAGSFLPGTLAYIDPGTGSYLLQIIVAGLLGTAFAVKMSWHAGVSFVRGLFAGRAGADAAAQTVIEPAQTQDSQPADHNCADE